MKDGVFRFRQFSVHNELSAMKVGTDGVVLGAWADVEGARTVLDAGAGTGLIALMMAQRAALAEITAVEIDPVAAAEARRNVEESPWSQRIQVVCSDINALLEEDEATAGRFDLIVSNPPFFTAGEHAPCARRHRARHEGSLGVETLVRLARKAGTPRCRLAFIAPTGRNHEIETLLAMGGMEVARIVDVCTAPGKPAKRRLWEAVRREAAVYPAQMSTELLRDASGEPSAWMRRLTDGFYLQKRE